eukprot:GFYU01004800.1.p1 GENE.GFYU01004800.1~~GFYU01004800.1.p1  ORF type:complete len:447 (-),score=97.58 GFYU01004800.1:114-1454(-)
MTQDTLRTVIQTQLNNTLDITQLPFGVRKDGKVRDRYIMKDGRVLMVTTDRLTAFDRSLTSIPFKGQVLNSTAAWWFENTKHIIPNHVISVPDPAAMLVKECAPFLVEVVVRGYMTGSTSTSIWTNYQKGVRNYCGNDLPDGMVKNQKLAQNIVTPTTKSDIHDRPISGEEVVSEGLASAQDWEYISTKALELFAFGQETAAKRGLILVDTKYEFGRDSEGNIVIIDEMHTPDSSRYWIADSYDDRFKNGQEPENIDKEFVRKWYAGCCDPYNDEVLPQPPSELLVELSSRYIMLFEKITGQMFDYSQCLGHSSDVRLLNNLVQDEYFAAFNSTRAVFVVDPSLNGEGCPMRQAAETFPAHCDDVTVVSVVDDIKCVLSMIDMYRHSSLKVLYVVHSTSGVLADIIGTHVSQPVLNYADGSSGLATRACNVTTVQSVCTNLKKLIS